MMRHIQNDEMKKHFQNNTLVGKSAYALANCLYLIGLISGSLKKID